MSRTRWSCERIAAELRELDAAGVEMSSAHLRENYRRLYSAIYYHFGSIDAAMDAAGVIKVRHNRQWSRDAVIGEIRRMHRRGLDLRFSKIDDSLGVTARKHFGSWDDALRAAGIDPRDVRTHRIWDAEAVVDAMMEHIASGRSLRASRAREEDPALYHAAHRHCGGFSHAVALARAKIGDGVQLSEGQH